MPLRARRMRTRSKPKSRRRRPQGRFGRMEQGGEAQEVSLRLGIFFFWPFLSRQWLPPRTARARLRAGRTTRGRAAPGVHTADQCSQALGNEQRRTAMEGTVAKSWRRRRARRRWSGSVTRVKRPGQTRSLGEPGRVRLQDHAPVQRLEAAVHPPINIPGGPWGPRTGSGTGGGTPPEGGQREGGAPPALRRRCRRGGVPPGVPRRSPSAGPPGGPRARAPAQC